MADPITFKYRFHFDSGDVTEHCIRIDPVSFALIPEITETAKAYKWTHLEFKKCVHCPLKVEKFPNCPVAENIAAVADAYKEFKSYLQVKVEVVSKERVITKNLSLQEGVHSIFGLIMATSGCPHMSFLKPMARFHLPFSSYEETLIRVTSFYMLRQYLIWQKGGKGDFEMKNLEALYANVQKVNEGIINRIRSVTNEEVAEDTAKPAEKPKVKGDANANSIVILDSYAQLLGMHFSSGLQEIEKYFPSATETDTATETKTETKTET